MVRIQQVGLKEYVFKCECGRAETFTSANGLSGARGRAKKAGWTREAGPAGWIDTCPVCVDRNAADQQAAGERALSEWTPERRLAEIAKIARAARPTVRGDDEDSFGEHYDAFSRIILYATEQARWLEANHQHITEKEQT